MATGLVGVPNNPVLEVAATGVVGVWNENAEVSMINVYNLQINN